MKRRPYELQFVNTSRAIEIAATATAIVLVLLPSFGTQVSAVAGIVTVAVLVAVGMVTGRWLEPHRLPAMTIGLIRSIWRRRTERPNPRVNDKHTQTLGGVNGWWQSAALWHPAARSARGTAWRSSVQLSFTIATMISAAFTLTTIITSPAKVQHAVASILPGAEQVAIVTPVEGSRVDSVVRVMGEAQVDAPDRLWILVSVAGSDLWYPYQPALSSNGAWNVTLHLGDNIESRRRVNIVAMIVSPKVDESLQSARLSRAPIDMPPGIVVEQVSVIFARGSA